jgi:hypothetical protein
MEHLSLFIDHQILEMSVSHGHEVSRYSITSARIDIILVDLALTNIFVRICEVFKIRLHIVIFLESDLLNGFGVLNEFERSIIISKWNTFVKNELHVEVNAEPG